MKSSLPHVLPVIHHAHMDLSLEQARIALDFGADGVFLISHNNDDASLIPLAARLRKERPTAWIGINFLSLNLTDAFQQVAGSGVRIDGLWTDRPGVSSSGYDTEALHLATRRASLEDAGQPVPSIFASVAFKYQAPDPNPGQAAAKALELNFIPTTSGSATGSAPALSKIEGIREAIGMGHPLACASGMTVDNIASFAPLLSHILVATGVSLDEHHFDPPLLEAFIRLARASRQSPSAAGEAK